MSTDRRRTTGPLPSMGTGCTCPSTPCIHDKVEVQVFDMRHRNSAERKGEPVYDGVLRYFPDALAAISRVSKAGNDKHNPGEPLHWARGKSTDQMNCVVRHSFTPEALDPDTGEAELAHAAWRLLAQLQLLEEARLARAGIIPYSGITP